MSFDYLLALALQTDVTRVARVEAPTSLVKVSPTGQVRPVADGSGGARVVTERHGHTCGYGTYGTAARHALGVGS